MHRLPRLHTWYSALMPSTWMPIQRPISPNPGRSTFTTSAPWSASSATAYGPVAAIERSRMRMPWSGPVGRHPRNVSRSPGIARSLRDR